MTKRGWILFLALGVIVLKEPLTIGMAIGFPLVIVGSILGTSRIRLETRHRPELPIVTQER